jgi:ABC-type oligopeptide transport system substrate-binding subunit
MTPRILLPLAALLALAACGNGDDAAPGATLRIDAIGDFDPAASRTTLGDPRAVLTDATQVGLVDLDANGQVVPGLATSWRVSDDGLSYIFRLRAAKWADGRELTAGDVVAVYRRVFEPGSRHPLKETLAALANAPDVAAGRKPTSALGVDDPLPNIVEIRLTAPQPELLQLLADPSMSVLRRGDMPEALGAFAADDGDARPIPLVANARYYDADAVALDKAELMPVPDAEAAVARFRRGASDVVIGGTVAGLNGARIGATAAALRLSPAYATYGYVLNMKRGALVDRRVRRALTLAVDRDGIVSRVFGIPAMQPVLGLAPPPQPGYLAPAQPDWAPQPLDARMAEAARLLDQAGYPPGVPLTVTIALPQGREHAAVAAAVAAAWGQIGVTTKTVTRTAAAHASALAKNDFDLALVERIAPADSPLFFLVPFRCAAKRGGYCNADADRLLDAANRQTDIALRVEAFRRAEKLMLDDVPAIPLFVPVRWALVNPGVSGWNDNILGAHPLARLDMLPEGNGPR